MSSWYKNATIYQIYIQSFKDTNGDGIGDFRGITESLAYIKSLGVNAIWITPFFKSPLIDNGYDISDYNEVNPIFGTMEDLDELIFKAHSFGIRVIIDGVYNHTSDEHNWFEKSKQSKCNDFSDFYIWRDPIDGHAPSNAGSVFGGSAWEYVEERKQYYFHLFAAKQPDLNWDNHQVREAIYDSMTFWLKKGIDGFRFDSICFISKDQNFKQVDQLNSQGYGLNYIGTANGPNLHKYLHEMYEKVLKKYDAIAIGEASRTNSVEANLYVAPERQELDMIFNFEPMHVDDGENGNISDVNFKMSDLRSIYDNWEKNVPWNALYLGNHDQPRIVSRFGDDKRYRVESAKMLAAMLYLQKGTPFIFQGDEIGMTNVNFQQLEDLKDIDADNKYRTLLNQGVGKSEALRLVKKNARSNARTPMQWDSSIDAGFGSKNPWINVNNNYREINVEKQCNENGSILSFYQKLFALRSSYPVFINGDFNILNASDSSILTYTRSDEDKTMLIICSFDDQKVRFCRPSELKYNDSKLLLSNYEVSGDSVDQVIVLKPYETRVYLLQ